MMGDEGSRFVWDFEKERINILKHGISFGVAMLVFADPAVRIYIDERHSKKEERFYAVGEVDGRVVTVRFTYREERIRIFGAGFWRKGRKDYEEKKKSNHG